MDNDDIQVHLVRLEGKIDLLVQADSFRSAQAKADDLVNRVSKLERSWAWLVGAGMAGGALLGWIGNIVTKALD